MSRLLDDDKVVIDDPGGRISFHTDLSSDREVLALGEKATVEGIIIANSSLRNAEVTGIDATGSTKFTGTVKARESEVFNVKFTTSGGFTLQSLPAPAGGNIFATVFYVPA